MMYGCEWLVEAYGCRPDALRDLRQMQALLDAMVRDLPLHPVGEAVWHQFAGEGGITGLCLLAESHFAVHTYPEHGSLCLNLFCCKPRPEWHFQSYMMHEFGAAEVRVRRLERHYQPPS